MKEEKVSLFDLVLEKISKYKGYTVFEMKNDSDAGCQIFHFSTKEEFEKNFQSTTHPLYKCNFIQPMNKLKSYGDSCDALIDKSEFYIEGDLYLCIDGKLQK